MDWRASQWQPQGKKVVPWGCAAERNTEKYSQT